MTGREGIADFKHSGKFRERVEIYWKYQVVHNGMPSDQDAELMDEVCTLLRKVMEKDKLAILTGMYTGDGERTLVFYSRTARVVGERLNEALESYPVLPIELYVEADPDWAEYAEMLEMQAYGE